MADKVPYHQRVAEEVIKRLKEGTAPWQKPWKAGEQPGRPVNVLTGKAYRGWNSVYLAMAQPDQDPRWCTYKQAKELGAQVRKGSSGTVIQYWQTTTKELIKGENDKPLLNENGEKQYKNVTLERPRAFHAVVFHASQMDGLPPLEVSPKKPEWERHAEADRLLTRSGAVIHHDQRDRAFYRLGTDSIHLPQRQQFETPDKYYATALHELGHWSGHGSRLNLDMSHKFGTEEYAKEELRAEIASYMLGTELELGHDPGQHMAYVGNWVKAIEDDGNEIFRACRDAERIVGYVKEFTQEQNRAVQQPERGSLSMSLESKQKEHYLASEKTWLSVPFPEKEQAKKCGARWDKTEKSWYAPKGSDLQALKQWLPENQNTQERPVDPVVEFTEALKDAGLQLEGNAKMDGQMHRVPVKGGSAGRQDGAYKGFLDGHPAGFIQNFKTGFKSNWKASGQRLDATQIARVEMEARAKVQARGREQEKAYKLKSEAITREFNKLPPADLNHPYLQKKELNNTYGARQDARGNLVIPLTDTQGQIWSVQRIGQGYKGFVKGAKVQGNYHVLGGMNELLKEPASKPVLISSGFATSGSIQMATGQCVVATFQDVNLEAVAKEIKTLLPDRNIVVLGDDDRHNPDKGLPNSGREKAEEAAKTVGGVALFPRFTEKETGKEHTDFSDLHRVAGLKTVKRQIDQGLSFYQKENQYSDSSLKEQLMRRMSEKKSRSQSLVVSH